MWDVVGVKMEETLSKEAVRFEEFGRNDQSPDPETCVASKTTNCRINFQTHLAGQKSSVHDFFPALDIPSLIDIPLFRPFQRSFWAQCRLQHPISTCSNQSSGVAGRLRRYLREKQRAIMSAMVFGVDFGTVFNAEKSHKSRHTYPPKHNKPRC